MRITKTALLLLLLVTVTGSAMARTDAIWARNTGASPITLDGVLDELAWSKAESLQIVYGIDAGIPGSGWKLEAGLVTPNDSLKATFKFLVSGDYLYLGAKVKDRFVGGSKNWERFDGLLMSIKDHMSPNAPKPPAEYFYSWWYSLTNDPQPPGQLPAFAGRWGSEVPGGLRTPEQIANWDAVTIVDGISNDDTSFDNGYTVEMRFKMSIMGYNVTNPYGDVIEWNIAMYDCDGYWPLNPQYFSSTRTWVQSPWGNDAWYGELRIWTRPGVTIASPSVPVIDPEQYVLNGYLYDAPTIDGSLSESVWGAAFPSFDIRYGDDALRQSYGIPGKWRAGQFQPIVNGGQAAVRDPGDATVKMFFKGTKLYMGFDVRDQIVQYHPNFDRWDGFIITPNDRVVRNPDNALQGRRLTFQVGPDGQAMPRDYLLTMVQAGTAQVAIQLKPGTTVDTLETNIDAGYTAELAIELTALGYPPDLGDRALFLGVCLLDGDSFEIVGDSYGTRTWWYRQYESECCPVWGYLDPEFVTGINAQPSLRVEDLHNFPNPGKNTTIEYSQARGGAVTLEVYDVQGRLVERRSLGLQPGGTNQVEFEGAGRPAGLYLYRIEIADPATGAVQSTQQGRMVILN